MDSSYSKIGTTSSSLQPLHLLFVMFIYPDIERCAVFMLCGFIKEQAVPKCPNTVDPDV